MQRTNLYRKVRQLGLGRGQRNTEMTIVRLTIDELRIAGAAAVACCGPRRRRKSTRHANPRKSSSDRFRCIRACSWPMPESTKTSSTMAAIRREDVTFTVSSQALAVWRVGLNELMFSSGSDYVWFKKYASERSSNYELCDALQSVGEPLQALCRRSAHSHAHAADTRNRHECAPCDARRAGWSNFELTERTAHHGLGAVGRDELRRRGAIPRHRSRRADEPRCADLQRWRPLRRHAIYHRLGQRRVQKIRFFPSLIFAIRNRTESLLAWSSRPKP